MEIGHNVMHGQYDWTNDPALDSQRYEWDNVCTGDDWRHSHNYEHHTFTNILGKDRDIGYGFLRVAPEQPWKPLHLTQPIVATLLALFFQWGVGGHDLRIDELFAGKQTPRRARQACASLRDARLPGNCSRTTCSSRRWRWPTRREWRWATCVANGVRNVWTFAVIFCGHFPEGVRVYEEVETENESRGQWYVRQLNGSANIEGERWLHVLTGHLSHQIEHHLFPDIPAARYPEMAPRVREICARYGQSYNTGSFRRQLSSVIRRLVRLSLPGPKQTAKARSPKTEETIPQLTYRSAA